MNISDRYKSFISKNIPASELKDCEAEIFLNTHCIKVTIKKSQVTFVVAEVKAFKSNYLPLQESHTELLINNQTKILKEVRAALQKG